MEVRNIRINNCKLAKNSRLHIKDSDVAGLMESIKIEGLLQPIGVIQKSNGYEVCYGNRRFLAYSKLGNKTIPAVIVKGTETQSDIDIKNLCENVQRSNLSLNEIGRYILLLEEDGLSTNEIGVRLGVPAAYIRQAKKAFQEVPEEFRKDVATKIGGGRMPEGKISISVVNRINTIRKKFNMTAAQKERLYQAAKATGFDMSRAEDYALEILEGARKSGQSIVEDVNARSKVVRVPFYLTEKDYDALKKKHVTKGPYKNMIAVCKGIFNKEISTRARAR